MKLDPHNIEEKYNNEVTSVVQKAGDLLRSKFGLWFLGIFAMADSALGLPIATDPFMVAYMVANRTKALWGYVITVAGSVLGGVVAYFLAEFLTEHLFKFLLSDSSVILDSVTTAFDEHALLISFLGAFGPLPFTLMAITAGALKVNLLMFIMGSLAGRAIRYGIVAYFVYFYGERAFEIARRNILRTSLIGGVLLLLAIILKLLL